MNKLNRIGLSNLNNHGELMTIIEYNGKEDIKVRFDNGYEKKTSYNNFKCGRVKNDFAPTVCGVGIVGLMPTYKDGKFIREYMLWKSMIERCYTTSNNKCYSPYKDVSVHEDWLFYPNFYKWLVNQSNYNAWINGYRFNLDKDILSKGNKEYGPKNCCLVPQEINVAFCKSNMIRGDYPIGVSKVKRKNQWYYTYRCCVGKSKVVVGYSKTIEDAFMKYKEVKENYIKKLAEKHYFLGNITSECYEAMMNYEVEITD